MPQVTLTYTFASEQEALDFLAGRNPEKGDKPAGKSAQKAEKPAASSPSAAPSPAPAAAASATPPAASPAPAEAKPVAYADSGLPALIKEAVGRDREGVVALLKRYGAAKGDQLKPEQFDAFKAEIVTVGVKKDEGDLA